MKISRNSRQRDAVYLCLENLRSHPTAEEIYAKAREKIPNISRGTVYRNLSFLEQEGKILRLQTGGSSDRFDANPEPHHHCVCGSCGSISDIAPDNDDLQNFVRQAEISTGYKIFSHILVLRGLCRSCAHSAEDVN